MDNDSEGDGFPASSFSRPPRPFITDQSITDASNLAAVLARIAELEGQLAGKNKTPLSAKTDSSSDSFKSYNNPRKRSNQEYELISDVVIPEEFLEFNKEGFEIMIKIPHFESYIKKSSRTIAIMVEGQPLPVPLEHFEHAIKSALFIAKGDS